MSRLKNLYDTNLIFKLKEQLKVKNLMAVPKLTKINLNIGLGSFTNKKVLENALKDLTLIAGQKAIVTKSKKSIAGFKIRENWPIGVKVTLRKSKMYEFFDRLISIAIPRIRDFRGLNSKSFDGYGNYNMGIKEQIIFPEIYYDQIDVLRGMNISINTTARNDKDCELLLRSFNFPLKKL